MPMPAMSAAESLACARAARLVSTTADQISSGSCSTQPGRGKLCANSFCAWARGAPPASNTIARVLVVPWSMARMWEGRVMIVDKFLCGARRKRALKGVAQLIARQWRMSEGRHDARPLLSGRLDSIPKAGRGDGTSGGDRTASARHRSRHAVVSRHDDDLRNAYRH